MNLEKIVSNLTITPEMVTLIAQIDEFKGAWQLFGRLKPERLQELAKVASIESIGSSTRIEGAKLTDREVEQVLSGVKSQSFALRDEQEVRGYAKVIQELYASFDAIPLTENYIKQLHSWLLSFSDKDTRHRGEYKKFPNHVEAFDTSGKSLGVVFETATPFETPFKMQELVLWTRETLQNEALHPLLVIGIFAVVFLAIHPFQDGNGRLSRLLTTLLLLKAGYSYVPYSSLESIIERNKDSYYIALRKTQQTLKTENPDYTPWLLFFLRSLVKQKDHLTHKVEQERGAYLDLPTLSLQILALVKEHGTLTMSQLEMMTNANRNTLKKNVAQLVADGHLKQFGKGRATRYTLV